MLLSDSAFWFSFFTGKPRRCSLYNCHWGLHCQSSGKDWVKSICCLWWVNGKILGYFMKFQLQSHSFRFYIDFMFIKKQTELNHFCYQTKSISVLNLTKSIIQRSAKIFIAKFRGKSQHMKHNSCHVTLHTFSLGIYQIMKFL